ncbi:hypothetical protein AOQ84DRAFT_50209 [Glonium stellatum]|uniref:Uncharacterized protein n=1 Tax=Glonium stellatum TaxID=574774 RepID=A0A8E2EZV5_9PEZI|nr:hypothetical protein AOQ84DRAFT_50209 [Glonium stellatum]
MPCSPTTLSWSNCWQSKVEFARGCAVYFVVAALSFDLRLPDCSQPAGFDSRSNNGLKGQKSHGLPLPASRAISLASSTRARTPSYQNTFQCFPY